MYIDYVKNDYSDKPVQERSEYTRRDKQYLASLVQERIANSIEQIIERWYELNDIGYIAENEEFLNLLKEAEQAYSFAFYTGTIAIVGISGEEYCRYLINKNNIVDVEKQADRIEALAKHSVITRHIQQALHKIRKIRNDCMHYNINFKNLDDTQLKTNALEVLQLYKICLSPLSIAEEQSIDVQEKLLHSRELTFREFIHRNRNLIKKTDGLDLQISPSIRNMVFTSLYHISEIDIDTELFKEMTLFDINKMKPLVLDLTIPQSEMIKSIKLEEGNIIIASMISSVALSGQTEEWLLLNIRDVYRFKIEIDNLQHFINIVNLN